MHDTIIPRITKRLTERYGRGITLVETVLSLLILGGAFVAALNTIATARGSQAIIVQRQLGLVLAEDLMSEILSKTMYKEGSSVGPENDEMLAMNRSLFDDMDDYHSWSSRPPVDANGLAIEGADDYTRSVSVRYVQTSNLSTSSISDTGLVEIKVTVYYQSREVAQLTAFRSDTWQSPEELY